MNGIYAAKHKTPTTKRTRDANMNLDIDEWLSCFVFIVISNHLVSRCIDGQNVIRLFHDPAN